MSSESAYIGRLGSADTDNFARLLLDASVEEERVLRRHLGNDLFRSLLGLATRRQFTIQAQGRAKRSKVVLIPDMLGSQLSSANRAQHEEPIWFDIQQLANGGWERLRLDETGRKEADPETSIRATGIRKSIYGELMLTLAQQWDVHPFWYDWRKDFELAGIELQARIAQWYGDDEPIYIVSHGAGALVARWYLLHSKNQWVERGQGRQFKLVTLGAPNHGLMIAPLALAGLPFLAPWLERLSAAGQNSSSRSVTNSFPSIYQLLPFQQEAEAHFYNVDTYPSDPGVLVQHLLGARERQARLNRSATASDVNAIIQIAGYNQPTIIGISNMGQLKHAALTDLPDLLSLPTEAVRTGASRPTLIISPEGDGIVSLQQSLLPNIPSLFINDEHSHLPSNRHVLAAIGDLLLRDLKPTDFQDPVATIGLRREPPSLRDYASEYGIQAHLSSEDVRKKLGEAGTRHVRSRWQTSSVELDMQVQRLQAKRGRQSDGTRLNRALGHIEKIMIQNSMVGLNKYDRGHSMKVPFQPPTIEIDIVCGDLLRLDEFDLPGNELPIDAISVGHYRDNVPRGLISHLDTAISEVRGDGDQLLLAQLAGRGVIRGDLAQLFLLDDPRSTARMIAIAGMGVPGRFGEPELGVVVRELCWAMGRLGKRHLATALMGSGRENLSMDLTAAGWIRGLKLALTGVEEKDRLTRITFVIDSLKNYEQFVLVMTRQQEKLKQANRMNITLESYALSGHQGNSVDTPAYGDGKSTAAENNGSPTQLTVTLEGDKYRFGAITGKAAVPLREVQLDPSLVDQVNDGLVAMNSVRDQLYQGQFLESLLIPRELRGHLQSSAPLVIRVDSTTARCHWELFAYPDPVRNVVNDSERTGVVYDEDDAVNRFWGTSRGLTRQLRTTFASVPESPPAEKRILRALVIADPAVDDPLPGAREEGIFIADLLDRFNTVHARSSNRIDVHQLIGPQEATRANVLRRLIMHTYDLVHFAGHCLYDDENPDMSGWVFSDRKRLSAYELNRVDRVPEFVFSNCCQSGITPDRSEEQKANLTPSFAEAFFKQGVTNLVCTAWSVDDIAARDFSLSLYAGLLGLRGDPDNPSLIESYHAYRQLPMHEAMRSARRSIARQPYDVRTWGAYQHYGNPYFQLFAEGSLTKPIEG